MKKNLLAVLISILSVSVSTAQWFNKTLTHNSLSRQYRVYVPAIYNPSNPASLVLALHGLGDNMTNFSGIGMNYIADTANIIVVIPQAVSDPFAGTAWNSGAGYLYYPNSTVNDADFLITLIDSISNTYSINQNRIYSCGFSMGGFMTNRLACEKTNRFSAIASVAGTIGSGLTTCSPLNKIPALHFHGTADQTVGYTVNNFGIPADSLVNFWRNYNNCSTTPVITNIPDTKNDGYTVDHYLYGSTAGNDVEFFKVYNAQHVWLGSANDINYTVEIWRFFNKHRTRVFSGVDEFSLLNNKIGLFPNPASNTFRIESVLGESLIQKIEIVDYMGRTIKLIKFDSPASSIEININDICSGTYFVNIFDNQNIIAVKKLVLIN